MKAKHYNVLLGLVCAFVLASRLYFALSTPHFSSDSAYFHLRQIEHIRQTGLPIFNDELSWSGRTFVFSPVFHYIIAFFALFMPVGLAAKILPNVFATSCVVFVYLIVHKLTNNRPASLLASFASGFIPAFFVGTANSVSPMTIVMPAMLLLIYCLMKIYERGWLNCYLITLVVLSFTHPFIVIFAIGLVCYLVFVIVEHIKQDRAELELTIFSLFFVVWAQLVLYKKLFAMHGLGVIWQNMPREAIAEHFAGITTTTAIYNLGVVPFVLGLYIIYKYLFRKKKKNLYLVFGLAASTGLLLWTKLIAVDAGLAFFGIALAILFGQCVHLAHDFIVKTKASRFMLLFGAILVVALVVSVVLPSFNEAKKGVSALSENEFAALVWLSENTPDSSVVAGGVNEGNMIASIAKRKNVIDKNFLLRKDAVVRYNDVVRIYVTFVETEAVDIAEKYGIDYIYVSEKTRNSLGDVLLYAKDDKCFELVYDYGSQIYMKRPECRLIRVK